jgi:hypothetical protein
MKNLKNLGKALSKAEQKEVNGGGATRFLCGPNSIVYCKFASECQQASDGTWNCNG